MILSETEAKKIIDLNPYGIIDADIAARQFQVILKGFNYLVQDKSDMLYIADEVGLGKTYIALGIASLLRHFSVSERRPYYKDIIVVPKTNLQYKWVKEVNNFVTHNYLLECNIVKSVIGSSVADCSEYNIHHRLDGFTADRPSYEVYRNSSFSVSSSNIDWHLRLEEELPEEHKPTFRRGAELLGEEHLKRLFAYLMNLSLPEADLLIVDEAHNFKHGIGNHVSYRNQVVSRLMGVVQEEDDAILFQHFPDLKDKIKRKAKKVLFLSATPIDNGLHELKQQLDCFLPQHQFKNSENINEDVKNALNNFMIRGLMKIKLEHEGDVSRNMYRHEHRRGNVLKIEEAMPQRVEDNLESIIIGLLQLKTLKHFNESNNKSFEIGMLAGFETFNTNTNEEREFENPSDNQNKAADHDIIKNVAASYFKTFDSHLPHPKQDNLINVLLEGVKKGNKSLVFVRRIASVAELAKKLTHEIESWNSLKIKKYQNESSKLKSLLASFEERHQLAEIDRVLQEISHRVYFGSRKELDALIENPGEKLQLVKDYLSHLYYSEREDSELDNFKKLVKKHIVLKNIKGELKDLSKELLVSHIRNLKEKEETEDDPLADDNEDFFGYFFSAYFSSKRYVEGFNFRKRNSTKDWYRYNVYHLQFLNSSIRFDASRLATIEFGDKDKTDARRMDVVNDRLKESIATANTRGIVDPYIEKKTFFNYLLENVFRSEFNTWVSTKWNSPSKGFSFWDDLEALIEIMQGIFRNGSGLLPAYISECINTDNFEETLVNVMEDSFPEVITELRHIIIDFDKIMTTNFPNRTRIQRALYGQNPISGVSGLHKGDINRVATQFRMPGYPYVLITTDILKEGEDLHLYCKDVYHYGIAWNPSDMEQRTGRIDRINSSCYFDLKKEGKCNFENSLQVFYPYLADTLEVNQVSKVFNKMNDFVQTFYDVSVLRDKDSKASLDEIVKEIPVQIKEFLTSKYDYENFKGVTGENKMELVSINNVGLRRDEILQALNSTCQLIESRFNAFYTFPKMCPDNLNISANINLQERRAPLKISLMKGSTFDEILFSVESVICRNTELRSKSIREQIRQELIAKSLNLIDNNDSLLVQKEMRLSAAMDYQLGIIRNVIQVADDLEKKYTSGDLE